MSPEWEKSVKAALDFFNLDAVTLMGFSLGGRLVIRAAAFEPRVRRVIAYDICANALECLLRSLPPPAQRELLGWIDAANAEAVDKFFADAMAKSLLLDWATQQGKHNTGLGTPYEMLKHYQKYETASISPDTGRTSDGGRRGSLYPGASTTRSDYYSDACAFADRA
jgi:pimeloyl-ACP methyl ester carboxylesterase